MTVETATSTISNLDGFEDLVRKKIENLRPKLLDLSRANPLISTRLSPRSNSHIRVVDELPDILFSKLCGDTSNGSNGDVRDQSKFMRFIPLPSLDEDPRDEETPEFQNALATGRLTDEIYLSAAQQLDTSNEEAIENNRKLERQLRDRVRESLGMPARPTAKDISLLQHAKNNGISPSYDLPTIAEKNEDGRHIDDCIQTLLLPDDLERKMNALLSKYRTWEQETGINILYAAFGFLEWVEPHSSETSFSPLVLFPIKIEKVKTRAGAEFRVVGNADEVTGNAVLGEKFKRDFGIDMPMFSGGISIEEYFEEVARELPKGLQCRVRRQIAFGVFPSARLAMFYDLDTSAGCFEQNEVIKKMIAGSAPTGATPFGDEYEVDHPDIEKKVPYLVRDADSSQFSALVDIADGKNLAVEGPPGTGKSQTIVNAIAVALAEGKKVLFVAEKQAALNVVKSRLEAVSLGEYVLPLQAEHSSREQVIQSISDRVNMSPGRTPSDYLAKIDRYKETRTELANYIEVISALYGTTGLKVYDIIGKNIRLHDRLSGLPPTLQKPEIDNVEDYNQLRIDTVRELGEATEKSWLAIKESAPYWQGVKLLHMDKFLVDEICTLAQEAAKKCVDASEARHILDEFGIDIKIDQHSLKLLEDVLQALQLWHGSFDISLLPNLCSATNCELILQILQDCRQFQENLNELSDVFENIESSWGNKLRLIYDLCSEHQINTLDIKRLRSERAAKAEQIAALYTIHQELTQFIKILPESSQWTVAMLRKAADLIGKTPKSALAIRNEVTADPLAAVIINQAIDTGKHLRKRREWLEGILSITREISIAELRSSLSQLSEAGLLSILSSDYRSAKKTYVQLSRRSEFKKQTALSDLDALISWKEEKENFLSDDQLIKVFGLHFKGIDTNFEIFQQLLNYYHTVDQEFQGVANRGLRKFLKLGDLDMLPTISEVPDSVEERTLEAITAEISKLQKELEVFDVAFNKLTSMVTGLKSPSDITIASLPDLAIRIENHCKVNVELDDNDSVKKILAEKFQGAATCDDSIIGTLDVARHILLSLQQNAPTALNICIQDQVASALTAIANVSKKDNAALDTIKALGQRTGIGIDCFLVDGLPSDGTAEYLKAAAQDTDGLRMYSVYATHCNELEAKGFGWTISSLLENERSLENFGSLLEALIVKAQAMHIYKQHGHILTKCSGRSLDELRSRFAMLDQEIIRMHQKHLRAKLHQSANPPTGIGVGRKSDLTEMGLINNEINKTKRFISVRELTRRSGNALLELKPCWMMSPLAVAQYVPKETFSFDLVIIDEASQMPPEDAIGALARGQQAMVVGDTNQLPPTTFWKKVLDDEEADEDETVSNESILELANAAFRPPRRLRWHYRSRHSALIKFSNHIIYNDDLIVFPSAEELEISTIVKLEHVNGVYRSGVNEEEARVMIDAVIQFMRNNPELSLGVVTLNKKQCDLLREQWDYALSRNSIASKYVERWNIERDGLEEFFIKNLENVQGDERDVIFIGTVYGPEKLGGAVHNRFGPINGVAGKRRLNVLFSRAKHRIVTFTSMTSADIKAEADSDNAGTYMLKRWLEYSATGILFTGDTTKRSPDSDFEIFVMDQIKAMGCEPVPQVGVAGYFIDIGVKHPNWPHGYIMAVECDGAAYHSSKSARDRDRLREEQIKERGWFFHRIWSTDWFNDPRKEAERLREAITIRVNDLKSGKVSAGASHVNLPSNSYHVNQNTQHERESTNHEEDNDGNSDYRSEVRSSYTFGHSSLKRPDEIAKQEINGLIAHVSEKQPDHVEYISLTDLSNLTHCSLDYLSNLIEEKRLPPVYESGNTRMILKREALSALAYIEKRSKHAEPIDGSTVHTLDKQDRITVDASTTASLSMKTIHTSMGKKINVYLQDYNGTKYLHIREWYLDSNDHQEKPTKKGIAIPTGNIQDLVDALAMEKSEIKTVYEKPMGEKVKVYLQEYKGTNYLHVREWYLDRNDNQEKPSQKGVAMPAGKMLELKKVIESMLLG